MAAGFDPSGRLPDVFTNAGTSSFTQFLSQAAPELLPGRRPLPPGLSADIAPHGTTIVAIATTEGVVMAGDRRATMGNLIASRDIEKVHPADAYSLIGIAGTAGHRHRADAPVPGGARALREDRGRHAVPRRQGQPARRNGARQPRCGHAGTRRGAAVRRLRPVPADPDRVGRIFSFDVAGGLYEETGYDAIGSGSLFAKSALKKKYRPGVSTQDAIRLAVEALYDAADDDTATGGPDLTRKIYPVVMTATADSTHRLTEAEIDAVAQAVVAGRMENPGG